MNGRNSRNRESKSTTPRKMKDRINNKGKDSILNRVGTSVSVLHRLGPNGAILKSTKNNKKVGLNSKKSIKKVVVEKKVKSRIVGEAKPAENISIKGEAGPAAIFVANLDPDASSEDVRTCFKQFGDIISCDLLYDSAGRPTGNAEVVYKLRPSAIDAISRLNNVIADGRTLIVQAKGQFFVPKTNEDRPKTLSSSRDSRRDQPSRSSRHRSSRVHNSMNVDR
ncbi:THO complex subunit 4C [Smittium mucronatum]|uniref:THO complex subunit 4C n=1 Tax=Smittium mucronatum TaxID=133383 RepID=A0A1R0H3H0_9FUNG|nr:THO complex subunit 4C [Smittium mucronatum]